MEKLHMTDWDRDAALTTARILLEIKAVNFRPDEPYTLTSGWKSPVYIDCRRIIYFPRARAKICELGVEKIGRHIGYESIEAIAGGETAGIPFAAWIADRMSAPMAYVRKKPKGFGRNALIEGDVPLGKNTLLVEDLTTDGGSKVQFCQALRDAGAICNHTFVVFYYGVFPGSFETLNRMNIQLHHLCTWWDVLEACRDRPYFSDSALTEVRKFLENPVAWSAARGGVASQEEGPWAPFFEAADPAWMQPVIWGTIRNLSSPTHSLFFLSALDARRLPDASIAAQPEDHRIHVAIYLRTLGVALTVTVMCILLGFPLAYLLAHLRDKTANLLLILVLLPFWTSLLVRTTAWMVVLQKEGVINSLLQAVGLIAEPLPLVFNRFGVVAAMTHILLPFMILPMYSVMRQIPPSYVRAARSLGASPTTAFLRVYLPQCVPGVGAGALLVFILALGYYITPALLGGSTDQMISYFVADNMGRSLNWGLASALAAILLAAVLVLYALYDHIAGPGNLKLG